jgi:hypothetical protein
MRVKEGEGSNRTCDRPEPQEGKILGPHSANTWQRVIFQFFEETLATERCLQYHL